MLTIRDHQSGDLFDRWAFLGSKRRVLLERSWAGVFRQHLLAHLPVKELAPYFESGQGRPTKDLYGALGALLLQQLHDLTDAQTMEAFAFHISWHYALDLREGGDAYLCERTLRNYRRLVMEKNLDEMLFRGLTDRLLNAFGVNPAKQRLDSTALRSAMRNLTRLGCVVETIRKFLRELSRVDPILHAQANPEWLRRYVEREGEGCFARTTPSESGRRLPEAGKDLANLYWYYRTSRAKTLESFQILERVLNEQFEILSQESEGIQSAIRVKEPQEIPCDNVRNPADPDSSYNTHRGQGYLAQVMETYQEKDESEDLKDSRPDLITHVAVGKMTSHDSSALMPALKDTQSRRIQPKELLADSHYGSQDNTRCAQQEETTLISPAQTPRGSKQGRLTLEHFELDEEGNILKCPAGHSPLLTQVHAKRLQARFDPAVCHTCPLQTRCPGQTPRLRQKGARLQYTPQRVALRKRRLKQDRKEFKERYRWRAGVEGSISRLKHQMGLARLRIRGMPAVSYVVHLRALGLNIRRCSAFLAA